MDDLKITRDMVYPEFTSNYLNVFDYRYAPERHYYNATRRKTGDLAATKDEQSFKAMVPDAVSCIVIVYTPGSKPRLLLTH